jgi:hypothetical protein
MNNADLSPTRALAPGHLVVTEPCRFIDRLLARALGAALDQQLAAGCLPESSRLLAARGQAIVSLARRTALAGNWDHLLRVARRSPAHHSRAIPLQAAAILAAEPAIRELMQRLTAPLPVGA